MDELQTQMKTEVLGAIDSIAQSRSTYQIRQFVVKQHDTPERQFQQTLLELNIKLNNIKREEIKLKKLYKKLLAETDEDERALMELDIEELAFSLKSQQREAGVLYSIFKAFPKYTYQQLQEAEEEYWTLRLARQAEMDVINRNTGLGQGNLDALRQAGMVNGFAKAFLTETLPALTAPKKELL